VAGDREREARSGSSSERFFVRMERCGRPGEGEFESILGGCSEEEPATVRCPLLPLDVVLPISKRERESFVVLCCPSSLRHSYLRTTPHHRRLLHLDLGPHGTIPPLHPEIFLTAPILHIINHHSTIHELRFWTLRAGIIDITPRTTHP